MIWRCSCWFLYESFKSRYDRGNFDRLMLSFDRSTKFCAPLAPLPNERKCRYELEHFASPPWDVSYRPLPRSEQFELLGVSLSSAVSVLSPVLRMTVPSTHFPSFASKSRLQGKLSPRSCSSDKNVGLKSSFRTAAS